MQALIAVIYAHRPDHTTPMEETVRAFNFVIDQGWAFYWSVNQFVLCWAPENNFCILCVSHCIMTASQNSPSSCLIALQQFSSKYLPMHSPWSCFLCLTSSLWRFRGTSEWTAQQIQEAFAVADRLGLIPPTVEQPEYNMMERRKVTDCLDCHASRCPSANRVHLEDALPWGLLTHCPIKHWNLLPPVCDVGPSERDFTAIVLMVDSVKLDMCR